jgi:hypothetical protein
MRRNWMAWTVAAAGFGTAVIVGVRSARTSSDLKAAVARLEAESRDLRSRPERPLPSPQAPAPPPRKPEREPPRKESKREEEVRSNPQDEETIRQLREKLAATVADTGRLDSRVLELLAALGREMTENKRLAASEAGLQESLDKANRAFETAQQELKARSDRLVQVDAENARLREQNRAEAQKIAQVTKLAVELQDVHRRRESLLASILRRYKDTAEQFRASSTAQQNNVDMARIQSTISTIEDDLRQLNSLTSQAQLIQKRIASR